MESNLTSTKLSSHRKRSNTSKENFESQIEAIKRKLCQIEVEIAECKRILRGEKT